MPASGSEAPSVKSRPQASAALQKLRNGEIGIDEYLDIRAEAAIAHLTHLLTPSELHAVRDTIRDQLSLDPVLIELVRRATGHGMGGENR